MLCLLYCKHFQVQILFSYIFIFSVLGNVSFMDVASDFLNSVMSLKVRIAPLLLWKCVFKAMSPFRLWQSRDIAFCYNKFYSIPNFSGMCHKLREREKHWWEVESPLIKGIICWTGIYKIINFILHSTQRP